VNGDALKGVSVYSLFPEIRERIDNLEDRGPGFFSENQRYETLFIDQNGQKVYLGFSISPLTGADASLMGRTLIFNITTLKDELQ
jgi:hypothetical protein